MSKRLPDCVRRLLLGAGLLMVAGTASAANAALTEAGARQVAAAPASSVLYESTSDPLFAETYVDIDEWRDGPVRHRYVRGGFRGAQTRFSFYFPAE